MRRIERLPADVVNRIAAGEVVQRPSSALKELLENSLDAGSTCIQVVVQDGGLELLQVTDDGHGIRHSDLPLLCERYATSKLRTFEELNHIQSFGFRGEALSSISYVARVTVTTMCHQSTMAWRCQYVDGRMQEEPRPCAGNPGTTIRAEKMFYNAAVRRRAFNRPSEEYGRVVDVVSRYALAFPHVAFSCRRNDGNAVSGGMKNCVCFPKDSNTLANIRLHHGSEVASRLCELRCAGELPVGAPCTPESVLGTVGPAGEGCFLVTGYTSDITLTNRKSYLCVFVNNRLVDSVAIRRALDGVYSGALVGGNRPFTVLLLTVPPDRVDVNIHPTKHEVCLLDEEIIVTQLSECVRAVILESAKRRQIDTRQIRCQAVALGDRGNQRYGHPLQRDAPTSSLSPPLVNPGSGVVSAAPCTLVRVEAQRGALDAFINRTKLAAGEGVDVFPARESTQREGSRSAVERTFKTGAGVSVESCELATGRNIQSVPTIDESVSPPALTFISSDSVTVAVASASSVGSDKGCGGSQSAGSFFTGPVALLDASDGDDDAEYTMGHFKRHRSEVQAAVGSIPDAAATERGGNVPDHIAEEGGTVATSGGDTVAHAVGDDATAESQGETAFLVLTSVSSIVSNIRAGTSQTAQSLFQKLVYVGVLNDRLFFAQSGSTLYIVDSLRLVRHAVYQRIFLRWATPSLPALPQLSLQEPVLLSDLISFAQEHDVRCQTKPNDEKKPPGVLVPRLVRRLVSWWHMLQDYFAVEVSADGYLIAVPLPMGTSWPPPLRAVPLFVWKLAAEVPYDTNEVECFAAIARHIAETLYGLRVHSSWLADAARDGVEREGIPAFCDAIRFGLLPSVTNGNFFIPPCDALLDGTVQAVVSVEELYKVFERC